VYALAGVTTRHNLLTLSIATDVKLKVADRVYYPDVMMARGRAATAKLVIEAPSLIVEVTSPDTRATDRREKLDAYRRIPGLEAYLIVDQRRRHVLAYVGDGTAQWLKQEFQGAEVIALAALEARVALDDIYEGVELPPLALGEEEWEDGRDDG